MELNLVNLKRYLRVDSFDNSHDVIILSLKDSASGYVSSATGLSLSEIEDNDVAKQAVIMLVASWFNNKDGSPVRAGHIKAEFAVRAMLDQLFATQFAYAGGSGKPIDPDPIDPDPIDPDPIDPDPVDPDPVDPDPVDPDPIDPDPVDPNADKNLILPATTFTSAAESKSVRIAHEDNKFYMLKQEVKPTKMLRSQKLYDLSLTTFNERQDVSEVLETTNELQKFYETEEVENGVDYKVYTIEGQPHTVENLSGKYQKQGDKVFKVQSVSSSFGLNKLNLVEHEVVPPVEEATYEEGRVLFMEEDFSEGYSGKALAVSDKFLGSVDTGVLVPKDEQTGAWLGEKIILIGWFTATSQYSFVDDNLTVSPFEDVSGKEHIVLIRKDEDGFPMKPKEQKTTIYKGLNAIGGWSLFSSKTVYNDEETVSVNGENVVGVKTSMPDRPENASDLSSFEFVPNFFEDSMARKRFYLKPKSINNPWDKG